MCALTSCPVCDHEVSSCAESCPNCGHVLERKPSALDTFMDVASSLLTVYLGIIFLLMFFLTDHPILYTIALIVGAIVGVIPFLIYDKFTSR